MRQYSQRFPARRPTLARTCSVMSLATGEDLASFRLGHSQDVLKLHEVVQLRHLLLRQAFFLLSLDQLSDSTLCCGRGAEIGNAPARRDGEGGRVRRGCSAIAQPYPGVLRMHFVKVSFVNSARANG